MVVSDTKRLVLVCGKGGVGKTTVSSALAVRRARKGQRVLLTGIHSTDQISRYFSTPTVGLKEVELEPNLFAIHLDEQKMFDSFIRKAFRFKAIYRRILNSSIYQYFTAAAPGFKELIVLDAIQEFVNRRRKSFDLVVVDCPATGHGVSYFNVGNQALKVFPVGPLRSKAMAVTELLTDQKRTGVILVTLAEEMPVNESIELYEQMTGRLGIAVDLIVANAVFPGTDPPLRREPLERLREAAPIFPDPELARRLAGAGLFYLSRLQINTHHLLRLRRAVDLDHLEIPFLPNESKDITFLVEVGRYLSKASAASSQ